MKFLASLLFFARYPQCWVWSLSPVSLILRIIGYLTLVHAFNFWLVHFQLWLINALASIRPFACSLLVTTIRGLRILNMIAVLAINAFRLFFCMLILLLDVEIAKVSTSYHNEQSESMPDAEDKSERILISNNRLGFIGCFIWFFWRLCNIVRSRLFDLFFFFLYFYNHWRGWRRNLFSDPSRESTLYVA